MTPIRNPFMPNIKRPPTINVKPTVRFPKVQKNINLLLPIAAMGCVLTA